DWADGLNPTQRAALGYLGRANRFSRAPSHVAAYLGATRGTVSQTLHVLERKGLVTAVQSATDKRTISYSLTAAGQADLARDVAFNAAIAALGPEDVQSLQVGLARLLRAVLAQNGGRSFGLCRTCRHHRADGAGRFCALLKVALTEGEADALCHEHVAVAV
ncbi:MAG: MarR family winged helix-turn-helix transcriptional regulator, partial [Paracoccaceae bacterium]